MTGPLGTETLAVVVVGDVLTDVVALMSGPLAVGSDTPSQVRTVGGGSGANVAAWLAAQGVPTTYVGRIGDDALGRECVDQLRRQGVATAVTVDPDLSTGTCVVLVEAGGERSMLPDVGANTSLAAADLPSRAFRPGAHLHLSGYTLLHGGSHEAGSAAFSSAATARMTTSVDPSSAALLRQLGPDTFLDWTRGVDVLLANREEAALLGGSADPQTAAARLADSYGEVVVKLGRDGALWQRGFITASAPADQTIRVVDTTGAGDAFAAGFLASWLLHPEPETALADGNRLAALAVARVGGRP